MELQDGFHYWFCPVFLHYALVPSFSNGNVYPVPLCAMRMQFAFLVYGERVIMKSLPCVSEKTLDF